MRRFRQDFAINFLNSYCTMRQERLSFRGTCLYWRLSFSNTFEPKAVLPNADHLYICRATRRNKICYISFSVKFLHVLILIKFEILHFTCAVNNNLSKTHQYIKLDRAMVCTSTLKWICTIFSITLS